MNNDEIVSNIISLIHSTTQSNYVICSQVSSKIFSYLSQIQYQDNQWNELNKAIEVKFHLFFFFEKLNNKKFLIQRFDQSLDHPDLDQFRQLVKTISICSNDDEERNYTLGRDKTRLIDSINQLRDLLVNETEKEFHSFCFFLFNFQKSHVNLHCFLLAKLIEQQEIRLYLIDLMNLTGMVCLIFSKE